MSSMPGVCGTGGWSGPKPGDPDNNSILSATPAFGGIDVSWTYPSTNPFAVAHVLVYRGVSADYMGAIYLATVSGSLYYDKTDIEMPIEYFYWIRLVSINGTYGELIGPASAVARPSIERTIEQLTGKIDAGVLAQSLRAELDQISILNGNLLNEITARENGEITLAQALADVDGGVAQALTFIHEEISSRVTADSAQAENLNLVAATLGDEMAAVTTSMTTDINAVKGTVNAMYTAKVNVNGLIGGFGLANNGAEVEAGFDVDLFWVGRTNANKVKPFIIANDVVYINKARIRDADIDTLKIAGNAVTLPFFAGHASSVYGENSSITSPQWLEVGSSLIAICNYSTTQGGFKGSSVSIFVVTPSGGETNIGGISTSGENVTAASAAGYFTALTAGYHSIIARVSGEVGGVCLSCKIVAFGAKR